jgi:hypothetical protein
MRKGVWISIVFAGGVWLVLGLNDGWVSAEDKKEGSGEVKERGVLSQGLRVPLGGVKTATPPPTAVDLFPVQLFSQNCVRNASGQLLVAIGNAGTVAAPATILRVQFDNGIGQANVSPINPGTFTLVPVTIPNGCFASDCGFLIRVDASGAVTEAGGPNPQGAEFNNTLSGLCIG